MHKDTDMTLEDSVGHLKIEEENHLNDKGSVNNSSFSKANLVE